MSDTSDSNADSSDIRAQKRVERLQIMITDDEIQALDTFRFDKRMPSRSAAVRELIRRGLAAEGYFDQAAAGEQSSNFGF